MLQSGGFEELIAMNDNALQPGDPHGAMIVRMVNLDANDLVS